MIKPAWLAKRLLSAIGKGMEEWDAHRTKTDIVVTIVRLIVVAKSGARVVLIVVPRPAAQHPPSASQGTPRCFHIARLTLSHFSKIFDSRYARGTA
jgi:hypothetical protein